VNEESVYGPDVSYTLKGAFVSLPNMAGVSVNTISRIGTRRSSRLPRTYVLREPRIGDVTVSERVCAWRSNSEGWAFIGVDPLHGRAARLRGT
jgi:hypothetical protein